MLDKLKCIHCHCHQNGLPSRLRACLLHPHIGCNRGILASLAGNFQTADLFALRIVLININIDRTGRTKRLERECKLHRIALSGTRAEIQKPISLPRSRFSG